MSPKDNITIIVLSELLLVRFVITALLRRPLYLVKVRPIIPAAAGLLEAVVRWAMNRGSVHHIVDLLPEVKPVWHYGYRLYFEDMFRKYELWQNERFSFANAEAEDPDYGYGYKKITCDYFFFQNSFEALVIKSAVKSLRPGTFRIYGVNCDTAALCEYYYRIANPPTVVLLKMPHRLINFLQTGMAVAFSLVWVVVRVRRSSRREPVFLAVDDLNYMGDMPIFEELERYGKILMVPRAQYFISTRPAGRKAYPTFNWNQGIFDLSEGLRAAGMVVTHSVMLWRRYGHMFPSHFHQIVTMPFKRARIRAFLNCYRPRYFWARDDYNVDHVIRHQELKKIGAISIAASQAVYADWCSAAPNVRYISYDIYYVFSKDLVASYADTWKQGISVRSAGSFELTPELLNRPRPVRGTILIALRLAWYEPEIIRMTRMLAEAFPDREVVLQIKRNYLDDAAEQRFVESIVTGLANCTFSREPVFDLLSQASYLFSDISALVQEGIRLGVSTFLADVIQVTSSALHEFPQLCVATGEIAVDKVQAIEAGRYTYPTREILLAMGMPPDKSAFDVVCADFKEWEMTARLAGRPKPVDAIRNRIMAPVSGVI